MTKGRDKQLVPEHRPPEPRTARESLSSCPLCRGEIRAILERHYSLCGGIWVDCGSAQEIYCENDCDLDGYSGQIPDVPVVS